MHELSKMVIYDQNYSKWITATASQKGRQSLSHCSYLGMLPIPQLSYGPDGFGRKTQWDSKRHFEFLIFGGYKLVA